MWRLGGSNWAVLGERCYARDPQRFGSFVHEAGGKPCPRSLSQRMGDLAEKGEGRVAEELWKRMEKKRAVAGLGAFPLCSGVLWSWELCRASSDG